MVFIFDQSNYTICEQYKNYVCSHQGANQSRGESPSGMPMSQGEFVNGRLTGNSWQVCKIICVISVHGTNSVRCLDNGLIISSQNDYHAGPNILNVFFVDLMGRGGITSCLNCFFQVVFFFSERQ